MKLKNLNSHARDECIRFDELPHIYYVHGVAYDISVTGFVHKFFPHFDADKIIDKMMNSSRWEESNYYGMTKEEIMQEWDDNRDFAAHQGTIMHRDIELHYNDEKVSNKSKEFNHFLEFASDYSHLKPYRTEWEVYDEELLLAGSIDMIFEDTDGSLVIYDWKRSKEIKEDNRWDSGKYPLSHLPHANYWHYSLQLNIYKKILEKNYGKKISGLYLLWLHPNKDTYIRIEAANLEDDVEKMFNERRLELNRIREY